MIHPEKRFTKILSQCLLAGVLASISNYANAQIYAKDDFESYGAFVNQTLHNRNGGSGNPGWGNPWIVPTTTDVTVYPTPTFSERLKVSFTNAVYHGQNYAVSLNGANATPIVYRDFAASLTTAETGTDDIWIGALIRVVDHPEIGDEILIDIIGQQSGQLNNINTNKVTIGISMKDVPNVGTRGFTAWTNQATPAILHSFAPEQGKDYWLIASYQDQSSNAGTYRNPKLWVFRDGDTFNYVNFILGSGMASGTGNTQNYSASLVTGASRLRIRTSGLENDVFKLDNIIIGRTIGDILESVALRVDLLDFLATGTGVGKPVTLSWETSAEFSNAGFNLYHADINGAPTKKLNAFPIPAMGSETEGHFYTFVDYAPMLNGETRSYILEDVEFGGKTTFHGPVTAGPFYTTSLPERQRTTESILRTR